MYFSSDGRLLAYLFEFKFNTLTINKYVTNIYGTKLAHMWMQMGTQ
jgi:hypothetical protein